MEQNDFNKQEVQTPDLPCFVDTETSFLPQEGTVAVTDYTLATDLQDLDEKIKSMMEASENRCKIVKVGARQDKAKICKVCGKEGQWSQIRNHIEAHHITGVSHTCNICGTTTRTRQTMYLHKRIKHTTKINLLQD